MPGARRWGSNTTTGPIASRAVSVAVRLSGRVLVVMTAPGASRMLEVTRCKPFPDFGGPTVTIESSTEQKHSRPRDVPKPVADIVQRVTDAHAMGGGEP